MHGNMRSRHFQWRSIPWALGLTLSVNVSAQSFDEVRLPIALGGKPVTRFQNGVFPIVEADLVTLSAVDKTGHILFSATVSVPDARTTAIRSVAVSPGGKLAVAFSAISPDGRPAPGLVFLDKNGAVTSLARTSPFHIASIVFADEGKLAALGRSADDQWKEIPGHRVLRYYDAKGAFLSEALPVESARINGSHPAPGGELMARPAGVAILHREQRVLVEVDGDGKGPMHSWDISLTLPARSEFAGFSYGRSGRRTLAVMTGDQSAFFDLSVAGGKLEARPLAIQLPPGVHAVSLLGTDGDRLALLSGGSVFFVPQ